jgi:Tfp pilus assembly PilM family ATPase/Tfp pilus assembly protein PilN
LEKFDPAAGLSPQSVLNAFKKLKPGKLPVLAYLPRQMVNIRMLELPSTNPDEIADMVDLQAGKQTPYSKDEIVSDYRIVGTGREGYTHVMLAIVQRSVIRQRFHVMEEAGIEVDRMSVSSEGLLNWLEVVSGDQGDGGVAILDVDSYYSDFSVVAGGKMVFTRSILLGANQLLTEYDKWKDKFSLEVQRSLEMSRGEQPGATVAKVLVTGAGPNVKELVGHLGKQLNLSVEERSSLQSAKKMPSAPSLKDPQCQSISLTALIGMGLGPENLEFNLIPDSVRLRKSLMQRARALTWFGMLLMIVLVSLSFYASLKLCFKNHQLNELQKEYAATEPARQKIDRMNTIISVVQQRGDLKWTALALLSEVHRQVPKDVALDSIDIDLQTKEEKVQIEGVGRTRPDVHALVQNLEQSSFFKGVKEEGSTAQDTKTGKYRFRVVMGLQKDRP